MADQYAPGTLVLLTLLGGQVLGRIDYKMTTGLYRVCGTQPYPVIDAYTGKNTGSTIIRGFEIHPSSITPLPDEQQHLPPSMLHALYNLPDERRI